MSADEPTTNEGFADAGGFRLTDSCTDIDWRQAKADLATDDFDNGRTWQALKRAFESSQFVVFATIEKRAVGMARLLSDGVSNAYLLDVWTHSRWRRRGVATAMVRTLVAAVPGQHVGWQTDDAVEFYLSIGARRQPEFMSLVSGQWLQNEANDR
jgi:ribosomal protein S18 acetylase RimI-like enzyme